MAEFTSSLGAFDATPNVLFDPVAAQLKGQQIQQNQQALSSNDMEMQARAAGSLIQNYPDEASRAAAYPGVVAQLQRFGFAKNAPAQYPGDATIHQIAMMGTPSQTQAEWAANIAANKALSGAGSMYGGNQPGGQPPPAGGGGGGGGGGGSPALTGDLETDRAIIAKRESGGDPTALNYVARADPTAYGRGATASGKYQFVNSTWREGMQLAGLDPAQYPTAMSAPEAVQDKVFTAVYSKYGTKPWDPSTYGQAWVPAPGGRMVLVKGTVAAPGATRPATTTAAATPPATYTDPETNLPVVGTQPGAPGTAVATAAAPGTRGVAARTGGTDVASTAPVAPAPPATPANGLGPGGGAPPAAQPPQPPQQQQAQGPRLPVLGPDGLTDPQRAQLDALGQTGRLTGQQRLAMQTQFQQQNIALQEKLFNEWIATQQLQTSQGQLDVSRANSALEYWKAAHPDAKVTMTGGEIITQDPRTGQEIAPRIQVTPQRADTAAMAIVSRLGPKVAAGTATPDEQAQYAVAVDSYRQPTLRENPVTKETVRVNTRELPAGFPEPPALGGGGAPGGAGGSGSNVVMPGLSPQQQEIERDPAKAAVADQQYKRDAGEIAGVTDAVRAAQSDQIRIKEMQDVLTRLNTGPGTAGFNAAKAWFQTWAPNALIPWETTAANLSGPAAAEAFQKLAFKGSVAQERQSSSRGGFLVTKLFQQLNPGMDLLNPANTALLNAQLVANQADIDYGRAANDHFTAQEQRYGDTHKYTSLQQFERGWVNARNPEVYNAAIGALNGQQPEVWAKGLSDAEYNRALDIVARANPNATINTKEGRKVMQPAAAPPPPPGFTVVR